MAVPRTPRAYLGRAQNTSRTPWPCPEHLQNTLAVPRTLPEHLGRAQNTSRTPGVSVPELRAPFMPCSATVSRTPGSVPRTPAAHLMCVQHTSRTLGVKGPHDKGLCSRSTWINHGHGPQCPIGAPEPRARGPGPTLNWASKPMHAKEK